MLEFYPNLNSGLMQNINHPLNVSAHETNSNTSLDCNIRDIGQIKQEKNYEICEGCGQKIHDRYLMRVANTSWHEQCLSCSVCRIQLDQTCFTRNAKLYCKDDYYRIYGSVKCSRDCSRCGERILSHEMVMRVQQHVYHLHCFVCFICNQALQKGEQFAIRSGQLICRHDIEKDYYLSHYADDDLLMDDSIRPRDGRRGPKRPRTILTSVQRRQFKLSFEQSPKPCRKVREALAKDTGLSVRVVQVWFQNQRAKMKKIQRKAKTDGDKHGDKDEKSIKQESPDSDHGHYLGLDGSFSSSSQPLNPNIPYSPDDYAGNSGDSMCSSDISLDGSNFDNLDEGTSDTLSFQNLDLQNGQNNNNNNNHSLHNNNNNIHENNNNLGSLLTTTANGVTHIDKLYLMQNSYFSAIE